MTEKEKKQYIVVALLVPVLLVFLYMNMNKKARYNAGSLSLMSGAASGSVSELISEFDSYVKLIADKEINDGLERIMNEKVLEGWERNPFEILVSTVSVDDVLDAEKGIQKSNQPDFIVTGIVFDTNPENIAVIIDGDFYKIGDNVRGWIIINVAAESVYFKRGEVEYIFNLYER
jgi:hypothetical protein